MSSIIKAELYRFFKKKTYIGLILLASIPFIVLFSIVTFPDVITYEGGVFGPTYFFDLWNFASYLYIPQIVMVLLVFAFFEDEKNGIINYLSVEYPSRTKIIISKLICCVILYLLYLLCFYLFAYLGYLLFLKGSDIYTSEVDKVLLEINYKQFICFNCGFILLMQLSILAASKFNALFILVTLIIYTVVCKYVVSDTNWLYLPFSTQHLDLTKVNILLHCLIVLGYSLIVLFIKLYLFKKKEIKF